MAMAHDLNQETIEQFLSPNKGWVTSQEAANEFVYTYIPKRRPNIQIKVYSSVRKRDGERRAKGKDAIRVCAVNLKTNRGLVKSKKILRIPTWRKNLKRAVIETINEAWQRN